MWCANSWPFSGSTWGSLDPNLVGARNCDKAITFGRSGHGRPAILHHDVAALVGGSCFQERNTLCELRIPLGLLEADRSQRCDHVGSRLLCGYLPGCAACYPTTPVEPDHRHCNCAACHAVE